MLISMGMDTGTVAKNRQSDDCRREIMPAAWNPVLANLQEVAAEMAGQMTQRRAMPASMAGMDVDAFLQKMDAIRR